MEIVFVHLNSRIPIHLYLNLRRTKRLFSTEAVTLISNKRQHVPRGVKVHIYEEKANWSEVETRLEHPKEFRNNFWMTSLGRFIALAEYQSLIKKSILHIESDVIIAEDFPVAAFKKLQSNISYPLLSPERGIASILFLKHENDSNTLVKQLQTSTRNNPFTSDMLILGELFNNNPDIALLPIGPNSPDCYRDFTPEAILQRWQRERTHFLGVFDGWDIGGFFFGTDPRNARGRSFLQRPVPSEFASVENWEIQYSSARNFVDILENGVKIPLYCLHLTSKQLTLFKVKLSQKRIEKFVKKSNTEYSKFYIRVMLHQAILALFRRIRKVLR